ncbi:MAG TPA: hypothetical protein VFJ95_07360 [Gammaproteobacteria bacterium]|nr:hypothetical protein [Gammaproteobacteria bacterium]
MIIRTTLAGLLLLAAVHRAAAQDPDLERKLATAKRAECKFSVLATATWDGKTPRAAVTATTIQAAFHDIDVDGGTAEADSTFGSSFIAVRYVHGYLHLMQTSDAGPLYVTTILAQRLPDGRLMGIQTRLEYSPTILPGFTSRPEMYVGSCTIGN